jgi:hypothetical protein
MPQTNTSVVLEVVPESTGRLLEVIEKLKAEKPYERLKQTIPTMHFMAMSVFQDAHYDPLLIIEVNFDGPAGPFWAQFEAALGDYVLAMVCCCKRPADHTGPLYDAVTKSKTQRYPLAPYLEARTIPASVAHQGNRGLYRQRILDEATLFEDVRKELAGSGNTLDPYRGKTAGQIHSGLRQALNAGGRLDAPVPPRISWRDNIADLARLLGFVIMVLCVLAVPGIAFVTWLRAFFPAYEGRALLLLLVLTAIIGLALYLTRKARKGEAAPARSGSLVPSFKSELSSYGNPLTLGLALLALLAAAVLVISGVAAICKTAFDCYGADARLCFRWSIGGNFKIMLNIALVGVYTIFTVSLPGIFAWLRWLERRDSHHDAPPVNLAELRKMVHREDWVPQNHMGSAVIVKPGVLRMALFRIGHLGLGLILRVFARNGYLGSMRTVHFAQWLFVNNGSRLIFFSNFDFSWDSYLDDFIEKAHNGLTLAWGSCIGFPATRFLVMDGASHGRQFKQWARSSMAVSRFWFSAYRDLTVNQIERNARIAEGLRKKSLGSKEALAWARDL